MAKIISKVCLEAFKNTNKNFLVKFLSLIRINELPTKKLLSLGRILPLLQP